MNVGKVVQVIGPTVDVAFDPDKLPKIFNAIMIEDAERGIKLTVEVALHVGDNVVRCIAMGSTDGLVRGMAATDTGAPITVPVGEECLGRIFNLLGEPIDGKGPVNDRRSATRSTAPSPPFDGAGDREAALRDRHQGRRPARALPARRQGRPVRRRRRRQDGAHPGADPQHRHRARRLLGVRRRRRAHARGQRPLPRDDRVGRHRRRR